MVVSGAMKAAIAAEKVKKMKEAAEKVEKGKKALESIGSEDNDLGKKLIENLPLRTQNREVGHSSLLEQALQKARLEKSRGSTPESAAKGSKVFEDIFGKFEPHKFIETTIYENISPEAKEMLKIAKMPFNQRMELFYPSDPNEKFKIYSPLSRWAEEKWKKALKEGVAADDLEKYIKGGPNCYAYALGRTHKLDGTRFEVNPAPGDISGHPIDSKDLQRMLEMTDPEPLKNAMVEGWREDCKAMGCELVDTIDGKEITADYLPKEGERLVVMMRDKGDHFPFYSPDFHFMVREADGTWTHKPGISRPLDTDDMGEKILNPETCATDYDEVLGYYVIRPVKKA